MNINQTPSAVSAADLSGKEFYVVKYTSGGVDLCDSSSTPIGTLLRAVPHQESGSPIGKAVAVQLKAGSIHFAVIGASSAAVARGATLVLDSATGNAGKLIPGSSNPVAIAWDAFTAADSEIVQVLFL